MTPDRSCVTPKTLRILGCPNKSQTPYAVFQSSNRLILFVSFQFRVPHTNAIPQNESHPLPIRRKPSLLFSAVNSTQSLQFSDTVRDRDVLYHRNLRNNPAKLNHNIVKRINASKQLSASSLRHVSKPKIDRLSDADPETDNGAEQFDRFQVVLRD